MTVAAIIVAAGRGTRAGGTVPKQWQLLAGQPVVLHSIRAFAGLADQVILVVHPDDVARATPMGVHLVEGGATRDASVRNALNHLAGTGTSRVLIHDGARPLVSPALITRLIGALDQSVAAAPAVPVTDALWRGDDLRVTGTQDRTGLWRAQTPQAFHFDAILAAHQCFHYIEGCLAIVPFSQCDLNGSGRAQ